MSVTVTLSPSPRLQFFDANGLPLADGKLYSYEAGTSIPLATYLDSTGTTQNPNPLVLDSVGSGPVWLGPSAYKLVLTDSGGNVIWTCDGIKPDDATYLRLDGSNGPVTGAVTFQGIVTLNGGAALSGTITGSPTLTGSPTFSGTPDLAGGAKFAHLTSDTGNAAATGQLRLAAGDFVAFRNAANTGDVPIKKATDDLISLPGIESQAASPAASGYARLANGDTIAWRNHAGSADLPLATNNADELTWNDQIVSTGVLTYSDPVPASAANTTAETDLQSVTYGAGALNIAGKTLYVAGGVYCSNGSASAVNFTVKIYIGTTLFATVTENVLAGISTYLSFEFWSAVTATGASGNLEWQFSESGNRYITGSAQTGGGVTFNTTSSQTVKITITMQTAAANISASQRLMLANIQ